ncbi:MAG: Na/Pi cotransporter family protein, partial [Firmicutes bacterium]|nr:Na/Pi cotransporter family protein [Bacillota bacterium]
MDIFSCLSLVGGLAFFLFGMNLLGSGLEKLSGGKLEKTLEKMTNNPIKGVLLGAGVTAVIQSSSATTVMVVGFVNSGIMKLTQATGIIMGANIGTTITAWLLSLTGLQGDSILIRLLKPESFSPLLAMIGIILIMAGKKGRKKDIGGILVGFAVLMYGMSAMSSAVKPLAEVPQFTGILLTLSSNPLLGVLAGALLTAVIQSSSASVGILQALSATGKITYGAAIPVILGQNIGTCATALISCIGAKKNAKRAAMVHLYFNIIGSVLFLGAYYALNAVFQFEFVQNALNAADIAVVHTLFNVVTTLVLLPFARLLGKLASMTVRDREEQDSAFAGLDERFLNSPSFALEQCRSTTVQMAQLSRESILAALQMMERYDEKQAEHIRRLEDKIDEYEDRLGTYLVKLSSRELSDQDSRAVSKLLHCIGDFERISDHSVNILEVAEEMKEKKISFSDQANAELKVLFGALREILNLAADAFAADDEAEAARVEPLEQVVDGLTE